MSTTVVVIGGCAIVTAAIKAAGPIALGGRELPARFTAVVVLLAPALLAALVVTQALADGTRLAVGADTVGVLAGGVVAWRWDSIIACVVVAAAATAALRAL
ncbi:MAG TPA: AzlD domain-containing protein [Solirubrobacteraceae bacterium]|nr:AzlD domain-containing protein [Solirubrobacteraceae bacterium]